MMFVSTQVAKAFVISILAIGLLASPAAARDTDGEVFVQSMANDATALLNDETLNEQAVISQFQTLFIQKTAIRQFGRSALGAYSRTTSDDEFNQYIELLEQYATAIVATNLSEYSGEEIVVRDSSIDERANFAYVNIDSDVIGRNGNRIAGVRWLLIRRGGEYRIYDITVETPAEEGTFSLLQTQREMFSSIISNNGNRINPLLRYLRDQITESGMTPANMASN